MKTIKTILMASICATMIYGCEKEKILNAEDDFIPELRENQFYASMESGTKTILNRETGENHNKIFWEASDLISINGVPFTTEPQADARRAIFTMKDGEEAPVAPYKAYYPTTIYSGGTLTLPSEITYDTENPFRGVLPMYAISSGSRNLMFHNVCGLLEINLDCIGKVYSIKISDSSKSLSGDFTINENQEAVLNSPAGKGTVTINCGTGGVDPSGKKFYAAIPPGTYDKINLVVTQKSVNGTHVEYTCEINANSSVTIERNKIYPITFVSHLLPGRFKVAASRYVHFTRGNLQANYNGGNTRWRFAENQYAIIGKQDISAYKTAGNWYDLFAWGATGKAPSGTAATNWWTYSNGAGTTEEKYAKNLNSSGGTLSIDQDWSANVIGNAPAKTYRTMTTAEFQYILDTYSRKQTTVAGIRGIIIFPSKAETSAAATSYTEAEWKTAESQGAVFFPVGGYRNGTISKNFNVWTDKNGFAYWTRTLGERTQDGYCMPVAFKQQDDVDYWTIHLGPNYRETGRAVRLVKYQ